MERQREIIESWANANGHTVAGWAADLDVSGSVDVLNPETPTQLGDWLRNRLPEFDVIACWKLDRLSRSTINLNKLIAHCLEHDKTVVSCVESIDIGTPVGRLIANVIGFLAEGELDAIKERQRSSRRHLRQHARWHGGRPPYGYKPKKNPDGEGWSLEIDQEVAGERVPGSPAAVVRRIVDAALAEYPLTRLAHELTAEGIPTPVNYYKRQPGGNWSPTVMRNMLQSRALLGHVHHTVHSNECKTHWNNWCRTNCASETVRGDDGLPLQMADPLVTADEFQRVQHRLGLLKESRSNVKRSEASPLSGVAVCEDCAANLHHDTTKVGKYTYRNYRCRPCSLMVKADHLEAEVEKEFLLQLGDVEVQEPVWVAGDSHEAELREKVTAYDELTKTAGRAVSSIAKQRLQTQLEALDARIAELEAAPVREARYEFRPTGQTYGEVWDASDTDQRRALLVKSQITVTASSLSCTLVVPAGIAGLMQGRDEVGLPTARTVAVPVEKPDPKLERLLRREFGLN